MRKFLIITADDFGLHEAVNQAVDQANREGVLTAASLMVGAPAARDAVRRAKLLPRLRVGLHLVLVDGWPMLAHESIPALTGETGFMDARMFWKSVRCFALPRVRRQFEAEVRAQFTAYSRTGLRLDHVNLHKHFHLHPTLLELVVRIGHEHGLTALRIPDEPHWFAAAQPGVQGRAANRLLKPWVALVKRHLRRAGVFHNDAIFGLSASGGMDEVKLLQVIARLPKGVSEIYLHPAIERNTALSPSMQDYRHADELAALLSVRVRAAIEASGVATGGFLDAQRHCEAAASP
jgi:hopanoid biosynthesis associated protein HpnK